MKAKILPLVVALAFSGCQPRQAEMPIGAGNEWPVYLGDKASSQYSTLNQITPENVSQLEVAWEFHSGDASPIGSTQIQCNPIMVGGVLYGTTPGVKAFALDAATGKQIWAFNPFFDEDSLSPLGTNRGVVYWKKGEEERILFSANEWLYSLDVKTGQPDLQFGRAGRVNMKNGLGRDGKDLFVISNTPGIVFEDNLIMGTRVSESTGAAPGFIRAYHIPSGELRWVFHTIPQPGEEGYDTWPEGAWAYTGGANAWAGMALDEKRGVVYVPTGSAAFDFYGGDRHGKNLFANCILAIDAKTGLKKWHYQTVHHDMWDRDLPAPPNLVTVTIAGKRHDAVAQVTKSGLIFVLDRDTGEPLFPVDEIAVKPSDLTGEAAWPTQPVPRKPAPFARQVFTEDLITQRTPEAHAYVKQKWATTRTGERFIPPSKEGTIIFPGFDGGAEWGGAAFDPETGLLYVNANEMPWILTMVENQASSTASAGRQLYTTYCAACHGTDRQGDPAGVFPKLFGLNAKFTPSSLVTFIGQGKGVMPAFAGQINEESRRALATYLLDLDKTESPEALPEGVKLPPFSHTGYNRFLDQDGYPAITPPWGTLTAIDLGAGEIRWQVPLGNIEEVSGPNGTPTGTENYGGGVVTAGGLVFIAASKDGYFRAFDKQSGKELWKYKLPAGGYATPAVYAVNGRQYVVIACGGGKMGTPSGDAYIAFALPGKTK